MNYLEIDTAKLAYQVFGAGKVNVVIETGLCSCCAEWWGFAQKLSSKYTVLVYDRAGYGKSSVSHLERTPRNIADELFQLLAKLGCADKIVLIGHSQGGLYIQQFARLYPDLVEGLILIDPLSANDNLFRKLLSAEDYRNSGVDKLPNFKIAHTITSFGLGFLLKPLLKKAPPFYYTGDFSKATEKYILSALSRPRQYRTAIAEYTLSHMKDEVKGLREKENFPDIPLALITHSSEISIGETMKYGGVNKEKAEEVERIWQNLMKEYLAFSEKSFYIQAQNSSHYIHLTEPDLVLRAVNEVWGLA